MQAVPQPNAHVIHDADVELHDNPVEIFQGTTRKRRYVKILKFQRFCVAMISAY